MEDKTNLNKSNYYPRKCSSTNKILVSKDYASVQIKIGCIDKQGYFSGQIKTYVICGFLRRSGKADSSINQLIDIEKK
jgi:small subunit ribosomal protein S21e